MINKHFSIFILYIAVVIVLFSCSMPFETDLFLDIKSLVDNNLQIDVNRLECGFSHSAYLNDKGVIYTWGDGASGQLGNGYNSDSNLPQSNGYLAGFASVLAGEEFSAALKPDGTVWTWGDNSCGQLGIGDFLVSNKNIPVQAGADTSGFEQIIQLAAGGYFILALDSGRNIWAWGDNSSGQLGYDTNTLTESNTPGKVQYSDKNIMLHIIDLAAGEYHSLALEKDGRILAWGKNEKGQLGNGTAADSREPVVVENTNSSVFDDAVAVTAGFEFSAALKYDGSVWCWGSNSSGQLGGEPLTQNYRSNPVIVKKNSNNDYLEENIIDISAGSEFILALSRDGSVWAWGDNSSGQLGNGSTDSSIYPVHVQSSAGVFLENVIAIAAGDSHSLALKSDGSVWAWGDNSSGQLGNGTDNPVQYAEQVFPVK